MSFQDKYIELRGKKIFIIYWLALFVIIISVMIWRDSIYYVIGLFFLLSVLEYFIIKCPYCKKRPIKLFHKFPQNCNHCGGVIVSSE